MRGLGMAAALALAASPAAAQTQPQAPRQGTFVNATPDGTTAAAAADVESIDAIIDALYAVISGPAGQKRDWERMRSLFAKDARMMPMTSGGLRVGGVEDYIARSGPVLEGEGFFEREIGRSTDTYGNIAQVFSTYEARKTADGPPMMRGVNSIQLVRHGGRWWVVSVMWQSETEEFPLPASLINNRGRQN